MEIILAILVFFGVVIVAVLFFGGWMIVSIVRLLARAVGGGGGVPAPRAQLPPVQRTICAHGNCRAANRTVARFCRRCGRPVAGRNAPVVRRVAMW